ncbi:MAG: hypothetical protein OHK0017_00620 [Patescibacteria group bacterium]
MSTTKKDVTGFSGSQNFDYAGSDLEHMDFAVNYHKHILNLFSKYLGKNVMEVGAGSGSFTNLIAESYPNLNITSLEPSDSMFKSLQENTAANPKIEAKKEFLEDITPELKAKNIDSVVYVNVLEHIEKDVEILKRTNEILTPGGHVLSFTPAMPMLMSKFDKELGHYRRYTLNEMKNKMEEAGFEIVEAYYFDLIGTFLWWLKFTVLGSTSIGAGNSKLFDKVFVPIIKLEPRWLPFGKNIVVIGRKK